MSPSKNSRIFYGYWILAISFFCIFIHSGATVGAFSLFVKHLQTEFGWSRGEIMAAFSVLFLAMAVAGPFIGRLVDRYGVRVVISIGALTTGLGFILLSLMQNIWHFYLAYAIIGIGTAANGAIPSTALVSNWFVKRRGTAIGIMSVGVGAGIFALVPLLGSYLIPNFGWRMSYLVLAVITWTLIPLALFMVKTKPADMGLYPDGVETGTGSPDMRTLPAIDKGLSLRMALGTSAFWLIALTFFTMESGSLGVVQNQVPYLQDIGFPLAVAANSLTGLGLGSAAGKFIFGWLCDKIPAKYACAISSVFLAVGTILLLNLKPESSLAAIWFYAIIFGLGGGGWLPTMSMLVNNNFGVSSYGAIFGLISFAQGIGGAAGPFLGGYMYDTMNTYRWAFLIFLGLEIISVFTVLFVRRPKPFSSDG